MKVSEYRTLSDDELRRELDLQQDAFFRLRFRRETEGMEDMTELRRVRKGIARIKTILHERELDTRQQVGG